MPNKMAKSTMRPLSKGGIPESNNDMTNSITHDGPNGIDVESDKGKEPGSLEEDEKSPPGNGEDDMEDADDSQVSDDSDGDGDDDGEGEGDDDDDGDNGDSDGDHNDDGDYEEEEEEEEIENNAVLGAGSNDYCANRESREEEEGTRSTDGNDVSDHRASGGEGGHDQSSEIQPCISKLEKLITQTKSAASTTEVERISNNLNEIEQGFKPRRMPTKCMFR
jgi:hypothetical protein